MKIQQEMTQDAINGMKIGEIVTSGEKSAKLIDINVVKSLGNKLSNGYFYSNTYKMQKCYMVELTLDII